MYVDELPKVSGSFARPGDSRWDWLAHPSPYMKTALRPPDIPAVASPLPVRLNPAEQLEFSIRALGGGISREPSLERPLSRRKRTPAEALVVPRPEPVPREARIRKPSLTAHAFAHPARGRSGREAPRIYRTRLGARAAAGTAHPLLGSAEGGG